jgi:hypothetical protein
VKTYRASAGPILQKLRMKILPDHNFSQGDSLHEAPPACNPASRAVTNLRLAKDAILPGIAEMD